ncbi:MAG: DegT/DnrJ/EryC1/StrS family aminotransferase [Desulfobacteraceae bacterium]|nr:DegT/DnrJ/EryC1/StrS family aminotransferase [Pseudomonadota bacterium]MCG2754086.1 DegT/DnrJ/EryC1/StrS family aminotransferase [Desulfobacteraceae bacterium]
MISHSRPTLDQNDFDSVLDVLKSGHLAQGEQVARFEEALSSFVGVRNGVAVSSGTAALHLSLLALGVGEGDEVIIPSYVCCALLNAVMYVNAVPVIADIDRFTFNMDADDLKKRVTQKTKAIIVPHMFGLPADIDEILSLGIPVIEDCAQSIGAKYQGRYTGSFGVCSMFSFYATKMLATGEGGMILSDDDRLAGILRDLRDYDEKDGYSVRYNYKMTDIQAALGISQLKKLPLFIERRKEIAGLYNRALNEISFPVPATLEGREHIYYRYVLLLDDSSGFIENMLKMGIECRRPVFKPLHEYLGLSEYPVTDEVMGRAVSIPVYPLLGDEETSRIIDAVKNLL